MNRILLAAMSASLLAAPLSAQVTVTGPANGANCFPFGCVFGGFSTNRYQQVYSSAAFPGAMSIGAITFFLHPSYPGNLNSGSFDIYLSTTTKAVDGLNTTDFDDNLGTNTVLFGSFTLNGGAAPSELTFFGGPYEYDPSAGNLLFDLRVTSAFSHTGPNSYFYARNDAPGGNYSRAHNFGDVFEGSGLDTRFGVGTNVVPEPGTYMLLATGMVGLGLLRRRRRS